MVKIDLITGFLGAGKTTFLKEYARYRMAQGENIGILENDYGAVNVDMMLLQELMGDQCELEMVAGGCDEDCHRRRFKTKLIAMGMCGYDRVIVEPSGIYEVDEFFDVLREDPIDRWYEIGNVITVVDARLENELSEEAEYLLASQLANAGGVILSRSDAASKEQIEATVSHLNTVMEKFRCRRRFAEDVWCLDLTRLVPEDFAQIENCGYTLEDHVKLWFDQKETFSSVYVMNVHMTKEQLEEAVKALFAERACGTVFRIKGFVQMPDESWIEINATRHEICMNPIERGQEVVIVIGEGLVEAEIVKFLR